MTSHPFSISKIDLGWLNATHTQQCAYVRHLKTLLEHPSGNGDEKEGLEEQRNAIHQLHYITYGTWGDVDSIDMLQVQIVKNLSPLFEAEVWPVLYRLFIHEVNLFMTRSFFFASYLIAYYAASNSIGSTKKQK